jgi:hypothetical protein
VQGSIATTSSVASGAGAYVYGDRAAAGLGHGENYKKIWKSQVVYFFGQAVITKLSAGRARNSGANDAECSKTTGDGTK